LPASPAGRCGRAEIHDPVILAANRKKFLPERVAARPGFADIPAVQHGRVYEIKSPLILQPGPAALTDGLTALPGIIERWVGRRRELFLSDLRLTAGEAS
jgi:hypothetical protein